MILNQKLPEELRLSKITCVDEGHHYVVEMLESGHTTDIVFGKGGRNSPTRTPGLDTQSLVEIAIDRLKYFQEQFPSSDENDEPIELLQDALKLMNWRTLKRHEDGVLGNDGEDYES